MTVVATVILLIKSLPVTYLISLIYNVLKLLKNKPTYYMGRVIGLLLPSKILNRRNRTIYYCALPRFSAL